ncbi:MAG: rpoE [Bacteroidetes bacterium]|nr:rpoE [Bacteroidota bacterium]
MQLTYYKMLDEIIEGCKKGERTAQKLLYERLYGRMMGVCMRYSADRQQAMEVLNTAFMKVFTSIKDYKQKDNTGIEAWIHRIMVNTAIDHLRSEIRHRHGDIDHSIYIEETTDIVSDMSTDEIMAMVNALSPAYRAVFNLHVVEGYSHPEIAAMLGINEGTSKSNLAKAKMKLRKMIEINRSTKTEVYGRESQR